MGKFTETLIEKYKIVLLSNYKMNTMDLQFNVALFKNFFHLMPNFKYSKSITAFFVSYSPQFSVQIRCFQRNFKLGFHCITKQIYTKTTLYKLYFKLILTYNTETWTLKMINKTKIPPMDMKFLSSHEEETRKDKQL